MKRRLFIGSSGKNLKVAYKIKEILSSACSEWLDIEVWATSKVFQLGRGTMESLVKASYEFDYGLFVAAKDDLAIKKWIPRIVVRDNVIFEAGLFIGSMGLDRAFIVSSVKLPSDLNGVTTIRFKSVSTLLDDIQPLIAALEVTRKSYPIGHQQSSALAYGYYHNFLVPVLRHLHRQNIPFSIKVFIPDKVSSYLFDVVERHQTQTRSEVFTIQSHHLMKYPGEETTLWDIPRCLRTLESFAGFNEQLTAIGKNMNWENWMSRELENFHDALKILIEGGQFSKNIEVLPMKV